MRDEKPGWQTEVLAYIQTSHVSHCQLVTVTSSLHQFIFLSVCHCQFFTHSMHSSNARDIGQMTLFIGTFLLVAKGVAKEVSLKLYSYRHYYVKAVEYLIKDSFRKNRVTMIIILANLYPKSAIQHNNDNIENF